MTEKSETKAEKLEPWPDVAAARLFLAHLVGIETTEHGQDWGDDAARFENLSQLEAWLVGEGIGPLVYTRFRQTWPELASRLQADAFAAIAENSLHFARLEKVSQAFAKEGVRFAFLKGAALAYLAYPDPSLRTMSDIDVWVHPPDMQRAYYLMEELGFKAYGNKKRPPKLQRLALGEIQFYDRQHGLIELHWSPVSGWLLQNTANIDTDAIWARTEAIDGETAVPLKGGRVLAAEDMIIQLVLHMAVNHRFRLAAVRSVIDIALMAKQPVDWSIVVTRAKEWRVTAVLWCVLNLVDDLVGLPEAQIALTQLQPSPTRRALIRRFVSPDSILTGDDTLGDAMENNLTGYLFLLLLVDRPLDAAQLVWRTVWPHKEWLEARYGEQTSHWRHLLTVLRHGKI
ncbi:MAG: nucleotidyltransferase family protein [Chloroflexi bacterium]|nr:nucleotidyltransferase family protein [Chloroflexota bacterium]